MIVRMLSVPMLLAGLALAPLAQVHAQPSAPQGHERHHGPREARLSLQAAASAEVAQDTVQITLGKELEGTSQADVAKRLTETLNDTLKAARGNEGIEVRNGSYQVWPNTGRDGKITAWRGRVEVILESKEFGAASELAGKLSDKMSVAGIAFSLSPQARAAEEKRLLEQAAKAFRDRAADAARAFGYQGYDIRKLDLGGSGTVYEKRGAPAMAMRSMVASDAAAPPPQLEPGTAEVTVTVQGEVALKPSGKE